MFSFSLTVSLLLLLQVMCGEDDSYLQYSCNPSGFITVSNPDPSTYTSCFARTSDGTQNCTVIVVSLLSTITISDCPISTDIDLWLLETPEVPVVITGNNTVPYTIRCQQIPVTGVWRKVTDESWVTNYMSTSIMPSVTPKITLTTQLEDIESGIERTTAIVGEPLLWEIEGPEGYFILPLNCTVESGDGDDKINLVLDGCSLDTYLLSHFNIASEAQPHILHADFYAFRFASSERILILCDMLGCPNTSSACDINCPNGGRRKRNDEQYQGEQSYEDDRYFTYRRSTDLKGDDNVGSSGNFAGQISVGLTVFDLADLSFAAGSRSISSCAVLTITGALAACFSLWPQLTDI